MRRNEFLRSFRAVLLLLRARDREQLEDDVLDIMGFPSGWRAPDARL